MTSNSVSVNECIIFNQRKQKKKNNHFHCCLWSYSPIIDRDITSHKPSSSNKQLKSICFVNKRPSDIDGHLGIIARRLDCPGVCILSFILEFKP